MTLEEKRESARLAAKRWRENNPERAREAVRKWARANPEKATASRKRWESENQSRRKETSDAWRAAHPGKTAEWGRAYRARTPDYSFRKYGLSVEAFDELVLNQGGMCAICDSEARLGVDHCHRTGIVRGLLCHKCNVGLGLFKESLTILGKARDYLKGEHLASRG